MILGGEQRPKRVLVLCRTYPGVLGDLVRALAVSGRYVCQVLCLERGKTSGAVEFVQIRDVEGAEAAASTCVSRGFEVSVRRSERFLAVAMSHVKEVPDVVVAEAGFGGAALIRERFDVPLVSWVQPSFWMDGVALLDAEVSALDFSMEEAKRFRLTFDRAALLVDLAQSDGLFVMNEADMDHVPRAFHRWTSVLPAPVSEADIDGAVSGVDVTGGGEREVVVLLGPTDGVAAWRFVESALRLISWGRPVRVRVVGALPGMEFADLRANGAEVQVVGALSRSDWWRMSAQARAVVAVTTGRFPQLGVEALAAGGLVFGVDEGLTRSFIRHRENGVLCSLDNPVGFATELHRAVNFPETLMGLRGEARRRARVSHRRDGVVERFAGLIAAAREHFDFRAAELEFDHRGMRTDGYPVPDPGLLESGVPGAFSETLEGGASV
ncbi:MAG: hypothetical protein RIS92_521 [Verrucomicrobiota bacterium]